MKFNVTIKDNETGEIVRSVDCDAIVGALATGDNKTSRIVLTNCTALQLLALFKVARSAAEKAIEDVPMLKHLVALEELEGILGKFTKEEAKSNDE